MRLNHNFLYTNKTLQEIARMCQSADCQLFTANGGDKENFDVNNNGGGGGAALLPSTNCHCMLNRRTRRRHPATVQTPGRLEVGEVILEPLVSNRLEGSLDEMCGVDWTPSISCKGSQNWTPSTTTNSYFSNSYQPLKPYRFDVVEENLARSGGGKENGGHTNTNLGYNSNGSNGQNNSSNGSGWKYTYMSS